MRAPGALVLAAALLFGCGASASSDQIGLQAPIETRSTVSTVQPAVTVQPTATVVTTAEPSTAIESTPAPLSTVEPRSSSTVEPRSSPIPVTEATPAPSAAAEATGVPLPNAEATPMPDPGPTATPSKPDLPPSNYDGDVRAIRTQRGLVVPVRGVTADTYLVVTPCYNLASIAGGLALSGPLDVLIDPGHGGDESGAVGPNGLKESTVNLRVSELLRAELLDRGYTAELTRYSDERVAIQTRAELANALAPLVFVSIHHNGGFPEPFPVAGTEVFVQLDDPESARLGGIVFEEIQAAFAGIEADWMGNDESFGVAWRKNEDGTDLYGVLRRTPDLVSILTEAMFISTEAEADLLVQPEILVREAVALADALERWFRTDDAGSGFVEGVVFEGDLGNGGGTDGCVDPPLP